MLRLRVVGAMVCLVAAKLLNIQVPFFFKHVVDSLALSLASPAAVSTLEGATAVAHVPLTIMLAYGAARIGTAALTEARSAIFARVGQNAIRRISLRVFEHVHELDLGFHLSRHAGTVSRVMDRGSRGISFALNSLLFNIVPTALEIGLVAGILSFSFCPAYGFVTLATVGAYALFTVRVSAKRVDIRRK